MELNTIAHVALLLYVFGGYILAYLYAKSTVKKQAFTWVPGQISLFAAKVMTVLMPLAAIAAFTAEWHGPILPSLIGGSMNVIWFYAGCFGVLAGRQLRSKSLSSEDVRSK